MAPVKVRPRVTLQQGLDKEVFQVVRKLQDENEDERISIDSIMTYIQSSNSSLKRKPKAMLYKSAERVLDVLREDQSDSEAALEEKEPADLPDRPVNFMNKSITREWAAKGAITPGTGTSTPKEKDESPKKREPRQMNGEPARKKRRTEVDRSPPTSIRLADIGGVDAVKQVLKKHLVLPLLCPEEYVKRRIGIPRGILLHGPPGCGKTVLSKAFAAALGVPFIEIQGPAIVSGMSGESEQKIREHFDEARRLAPCLLFIDEIDVIAPKRDTAQSQMEKRIVAQLLISMDSLAMEHNDGKPVIVLAATNRPDSLDPALRRGGRFDTEINMGVPNEAMREAILRAQTRDTPLAPDVDFATLAKMTPGFVGADLRDLVGKAGEWSMDRYRAALEAQAAVLEDGMELDAPMSATDVSILRLIARARDAAAPDPPGFDDTSIPMAAFLAVLPSIQPSSKREGFATIPDTTWEDIGALGAVREELEMAIVAPICHPARYARVGISAPTGVLLWGPPGCGKTLLAKAVARESKANFISVKGPELLNKYVGESERAIRQVFTRARSSVPCVLFFDELDALVPRRDASLSEASARVVNTLLTELDGLSGAREGIYVVAATNRPDTIDPAMMRPGRLESLLYIGLPGPGERVEILRALLRRSPVNVGFAEFAARDECDGFSGADLGALLRKAGQQALRRGGEAVEWVDFESAVGSVRRSVLDVGKYERMREKLASMVS
ncbi:AAA family ATPase/60S ribosome export protein-like protein Rix7 [Trichodelitschia bisporula]|uniref:AAA family ATPase/60S ribosome export protein-like protein Rix7 n=1 Tax=Trichodelitschia bisporula TaxID=703511 RepID=A0A6G1I5G7_9PEZI|nr:AAA family ATPase/60S ribosome export protein-like protein Rix7 [Trichodelitschia bisporula]